MTHTTKKILYGIMACAALCSCAVLYFRARTDGSFLRPASEQAALTQGQVGMPDGGLATPDPSAASTIQKAAPKNIQPASFSLSVPSVGISAPVEYVGVTVTGEMATPDRLADAGWYQFGTAPGDVGSAVFAGHVDDAFGLPAVFGKLDKVKTGDDVYVVTPKGKKLHFVVTDIQSYSLDNAPVHQIFNDTSGARLIRLITCAGTIDNGTLSYNKRLVVTATLE